MCSTDPPVFAKELDWSRASPCADCPFLKTSPYHEGVASNLQSYFESMADHSFAHSCHKTDNRPSIDGPRNHDGPVQHCVGAILMLLKTGKGIDLQLPLLQAAEAGKIDLRAMTERAKRSTNVFTLLEMITWYGRQLGKRVEKRRWWRKKKTKKAKR